MSFNLLTFPSTIPFGHVIRLLREPSPQQIEQPIQTVGPSGAVVVPAAAMIIINTRMASAIDSHYNATQLSTSFSVGIKIHVTFGLKLGGKIGYVEARWYSDGEFFTALKALSLEAVGLNYSKANEPS